MNNKEKNKIHHDVSNAIVTINTITHAAAQFANQLSQNNSNYVVKNKRQMALFLNSLNSIREQTRIIESHFQHLLEKI